MPHNLNLNYGACKRWGVAVAMAGTALIIASSVLGKTTLFLLLNGDLGPFADLFFAYVTNLGDGAMWIIWIIVLLALRKKQLWPLVISAVVFSTLLTQVPKQLIFNGEPRPVKAVVQQQLVHYVKGVELYSINSFPSGHTTSAFTYALLFALLFKSNWKTAFCMMLALAVGYSRVYLGQHFPLDVGAGMVAAVLTIMISASIQQYFERRWALI